MPSCAQGTAAPTLSGLSRAPCPAKRRDFIPPAWECVTGRCRDPKDGEKWGAGCSTKADEGSKGDASYSQLAPERGGTSTLHCGVPPLHVTVRTEPQRRDSVRLVQLWWGQTPLPPREGPRLRQGDPNTGGEGKKKSAPQSGCAQSERNKESELYA